MRACFITNVRYYMYTPLVAVKTSLTVCCYLQSESEQSPWAESEQCSVEEFHYVTKAMFRYSVLATAQSAKVRLTLLSRSRACVWYSCRTPSISVYMLWCQ